MYNNEGGIADFGNYVVNSTLGHWCNLRLSPDGIQPKTAKELDTEFHAGLSETERNIWEELDSTRRRLSLSSIIVRFPLKAGGDSQHVASKMDFSEAERNYQSLEVAFVATLSERMQTLYREGVLANRDNPRGSEDLDYAAIQRLIFARVVELGWRPKLFHKYDSSSSLQDVGRDAHKIERIGKKYQWIAFHEILGRIADNFVFRGEWRNDFTPYNGPWQMRERDIDPSCLLLTTPIDATTTNPWWSRYTYNKWRPSLTHTEWTRVKADLPDQKNLLEVRTRGGWVVLDGYFRWEQPPTPGEERFSKTRRDVWYIVRSYIVKRDIADSLFSWAKEQDFMGRWMPDPTGLRHVFLREIPVSKAYIDEYGACNEDRWVEVRGKERKSTKFDLMRTTENYFWEGNGFDCSVNEGGVHVNLPARELVEAMSLVHGVSVGCLEDSTGDVVALDPSVAEKGPSILLVKKVPFLKFLREKNYELFWAVIGEKLLIGDLGGRAFPGRLEMGGAFRMSANGKLDGTTYTKLLSPRPA